MKTILFVLLTTLVISCAAPEPPDPGTLARFADQSITLDEVEAHLRRRADELAVMPLDELVSTYRETAERICVQESLLADCQDDAEARAFLVSFNEHQLAVQRYIAVVIRPTIETDEAEVEQYFEDHRNEIGLPERCLVSTIFRKCTDEESFHEEESLLRTLHDQVLSGASFELLAHRHSQSATRALGGRVGWVGRGTLESKVEKVVFGMKKGEVSEPVQVRGGLAIFMVGETVSPRSLSLDESRRQIRRQLVRTKLEEAISKIVEEAGATGESLILKGEEIEKAWSGQDAEEIVLRVGGVEVSRGELGLVSQIALSQSSGAGDASLKVAFYDQLVRDLTLYSVVENSGFLDDPDLRAAIHNRAEALIDARRANQRLAKLLWMRTAADEDRLRQFFKANRGRYTSPLKLKAKRLVVKEFEDLDRTLVTLEKVAQSIEAGTGTLEDAQAAVGGEIGPESWLEYDDLMKLPPIISADLFELSPPAVSQVTLVEGQLNLYEVLKRQEPQLLGFDEVKDTVIKDLIREQGEMLYRDLEAEILQSAGFEFYEKHLLADLQIPDGADE